MVPFYQIMHNSTGNGQFAFWRRILINLRPPRVVHITVSALCHDNVEAFLDWIPDATTTTTTILAFHKNPFRMADTHSRYV